MKITATIHLSGKDLEILGSHTTKDNAIWAMNKRGWKQVGTGLKFSKMCENMETLKTDCEKVGWSLGNTARGQLICAGVIGEEQTINMKFGSFVVQQGDNKIYEGILKF